MAVRPARLPFLDPALLPARRAAAGLAPDRDPLLAAMAEEVDSDPALSSLAWYLHWRVFVAPHHGVPWGAPTLNKRLPDRAGLFYLLLSLEFAPALAAFHARLGYPTEVTAATVRQIGCYELNHLRGLDRPGMYENQFPWLACYLHDPYVRLGRLEFQLHAYGGGVNLWRRADGAFLALAEEGTRVGDDGFRLDPKAPAEQGWTARYAEAEDAVSGSPADPGTGRFLRERVRLPRPDWSPALRRGDPVLDLHIPAGGGMTWEAVTDSFRRALEFFPRHHPDKPFKGVCCCTWFMDPQLAGLLPPEANPLRFQRAVYLHPPWLGSGSLWFVFQKGPETDPALLPRDSSLRRVLADFLARGGKWRAGSLLVPREHMADLRENRYREAFRELRQESGWQTEIIG